MPAITAEHTVGTSPPGNRSSLISAPTAQTVSPMNEGGPHRDGQQQRAPFSGPPAWVKRVMIAGVVLLVLLLIMLATGHGPGRHMHSGAGPSRPAGASMLMVGIG
jgi:hypothetical protein